MLSEFWYCEESSFMNFMNEFKAAVRYPNVTNPSLVSVEGKRAVIPVSGVLVKSKPWWSTNATSYQEIIDSLKEADSMPGINEIVLDFSSGGGEVLGLAEAAEAITNCDHKVVAYVSFCCSAAYYLASQCDEVIAEQNAVVGSIGVMRIMPDYTKMYESWGIKIDLITSGTLKGAGVPGTTLSEEQRESIQKQVDGIAANFKAVVMNGRNMSKEQVESVATGGTWYAGDALKMGLIDRIDNSFKSMAESQKGTVMKEQDDKVATAEELNQAEAKGVEDGRKAAVADLDIMLKAFPGNTDFAIEQFKGGKSLVEAKAAYADVLAEENAKLKADAEKQKEVATIEGEENPIDGGKPGEASVDFKAKIGEYAKENNCNRATAIKNLKAEYPKAYEAFMKGGK